MSVLFRHKKFLFRKTYFNKIDTNVDFYMILSKNFSTIILVQKHKIKTAKMKTIGI